jgi:hypothetical protein
LATFLIATLALVVAWGQLKANAVMAALPSINQRILGGKATVLVYRRLASHVANLTEILSSAATRIRAQDYSHDYLNTLSKDVTSAWELAFGDMTQIRAIADDVHDIDLENELSAIMQASLYLQDAGWPIVTLFIDFLKADHFDDAPHPAAPFERPSVGLAMMKIVWSTDEIMRFVETCHSKLQDMQEVDVRLVSIVQEAKETRLNLLKIIGKPPSKSPYD